jgi:hypothetical protein
VTTLGDPHVELDEWIREAERVADEATEHIMESYGIMEAVERVIDDLHSNGFISPPVGERPKPGDIVVDHERTYVVEPDADEETAAWAQYLSEWDPHWDFAQMGYGYEEDE